MKRKHLLLICVGATLVFYLNSCINKDYDWDNLNREITFQIGNVPLGDVSPIKIDEILEDRGNTKFIYDDAGNISLQYKGDIDMDLPKFGEIEMKDKETRRVNLKSKLSAFSPFSYSTELPSIELIDGSVDYVIPTPDNKSSDWSVDITAVDFESCDLVVQVYMTNIEIPDADKAKLQVEITFPESIIFDDEKIEGNKFYEEIDPQLITENNGIYTLTSFSISKFTYDNTDEEITYKVGLKITDDFNFTFNEDPESESEFYMVFHTPDPQAETVYADASFLQEISDKVDGIGSLSDIFGEDDAFLLRNPGMIFNLSTNIAFDLNLSIANLTAWNATERVEMNDITKDGLLFCKEDASLNNTTSHYIAKTNDLGYAETNYVSSDLNEILSIKPEQLTYQIIARTNGENAEDKVSGHFPYKTKPEVNAQYIFNVPFDFENVKINFEEKMKDVFSDDVAEKLFNNEGELIIAADQVEVQLGGASSQAEVNISATIVVYDYNDRPIDIEIKSDILHNGENTLEIKLNVRKNDIEKMKNARHLGFDFTIEGKNVVLNQTDHITIKKLKFKSTAGISWEF